MRRWASVATFFGDGLLAGGEEPDVWGSGLRSGSVKVGGSISSLVVSSDGAAWLGADARGLARIGDGDAEDLLWIRARPGLSVVALSIASDQDAVFASWSDGTVEERGLDGSLLATHAVGLEGLVHRVAGGFVGHYLARDRGRVVAPDGTATFDLPSEIYDLELIPDGVLVAAEASGIQEISRTDSGWTIRQLRRCVADAVARGRDGSVWIADEVAGLVRMPPSGVEQVHPTWSHAETVTAAVNDRWAVTTTFFASDLLAVDLEGGPPVRAVLPGRPTGLVLAGDRAIVSMPWLGLAVVPLDRGDWPESELVEFPWPYSMAWPVKRLCSASRERVLVMMGEAGVGVVSVPAGGPPELQRIIETPGRAIDCASGPDGSWMIADHAALLRLTLTD